MMNVFVPENENVGLVWNAGGKFQFWPQRWLEYPPFISRITFRTSGEKKRSKMVKMCTISRQKSHTLILLIPQLRHFTVHDTPHVTDWLKLREEYRIVGEFFGALPHYPRQETVKGLPLLLLPEEVTLLKEKHLARLVRCPALSEEPSEGLLETFKDDEKRFHESQVISTKQGKT